MKIKMVNAGNNWTFQSSGICFNLRSMCFTSTDTAYAVGDSGIILQTINNGLTWVNQFSTNPNYFIRPVFNSVYFTNSFTGYVAGYNKNGCGGCIGPLYATNNGGATWNDLNFTAIFDLDEDINLGSVYFLNKDTGYVIGDGFYYKTTDGGLDRNLAGLPGFNINSYFPDFEFCNSIVFSNSRTGYIVGQEGLILRTTDGGTNWVPQKSPTGQTLNSVYFIGNVGYIAGDSGIILKTINAGENWNIQSTPTKENLNSIFLTDTQTVYAVGNFGTILGTTNGGNIPPNKNLIVSNSDHNNFMVYPNPAKDHISLILFGDTDIFDGVMNE